MQHICFRNTMQIRREFQADNFFERIFRREKQRASLSRSVINEITFLKCDTQTREHFVKPLWLDSTIVVGINPVRAGDFEVAQIGPSVDVSVSAYVVHIVEYASLSMGLQLLSRAIFPDEVNGKQETATQAGQQSVISYGFLDPRDNGLPDSRH